MTKINELKTFDPVEYLDSDDAVRVFLDDAFETGDPKYIAKAIGIAAKAKGMTELSKQTGIRREQLYQSLSEEGNPTLQTLMPVLNALGVRLSVNTIHQHP